jgi:hypothetical protein
VLDWLQKKMNAFFRDRLRKAAVAVALRSGELTIQSKLWTNLSPKFQEQWIGVVRPNRPDLGEGGSKLEGAPNSTVAEFGSE